MAPIMADQPGQRGSDSRAVPGYAELTGRGPGRTPGESGPSVARRRRGEGLDDVISAARAGGSAAL